MNYVSDRIDRPEPPIFERVSARYDSDDPFIIVEAAVPDPTQPL